MAEEKRTQFAMAAIDFASLFNNTFSQAPIGGFMIELTAPQGQSTGGGIQARQNIKLVNSSGDTTVIGWVNTAENNAELRSYDLVQNNFSQRYSGIDFPITRAQYDALLERFQGFFASQSILMKIATQRAAKANGSPAPLQKSNKGLTIAIIALVLIIGAAVVFFFASSGS